jgi:uncharacterized protein (TIGR00299 family) protein
MGGGTAAVAWFHCFAGVAGDMVLGALLDAGAPEAEVRRMLDALGVPGWELRVRRVRRRGLTATKVDVVDDAASAGRRVSGPRTYRELAGIVGRSRLPEPVVVRATAVLDGLVRAEATVHGVAPADVHLHELGGHDTLVDVVGSAAALHLLGVGTVTSSAVSVGTGTISSSHGRLPNPPPAVVTLLAGAPIVGVDTDVELTTPTGAALMACWADRFGPVPPIVVRSSGFGAGTAELADRPNCLQVLVGAPVETARPTFGAGLGVASDRHVGRGGLGTAPGGGRSAAVGDELGDAGADREAAAVGAVADAAAGAAGSGADIVPTGQQVSELVQVETTVDDVTGETLAWAVERLLAAGALDAWVAPVTMKRGRPGHVVTALAPMAVTGALVEVLQRETGTLGVRLHAVQRWAVPRAVTTVEVAGHRIGLKLGPHRVKAEQRDVVDAAAALGWPAQAVAAAAEAQWRASSGAQKGASAGEPPG